MVVVCGATAALSSFLLFYAQPLFARLALPIFGGAAGFWAAAVAFAQGAVVVGYLYAHATRTLSPRAQLVVHGALLIMVLAMKPLHVAADIPSSDASLAAFMSLAMVALGPSIVVLAATGVVLQRVLVTARPSLTPSSYALYAAGSAGSLAGLLAHPLVLEPLIDLPAATALWTGGYVALIAGIAWLGVAQRAGAVPPRHEPTARPRPGRESMGDAV